MNGETYTMEQASRMLFFARACGPESGRERRHKETRNQVARKLRFQSMTRRPAFRAIGMSSVLKENRGMRKAAKRNGIDLWTDGDLRSFPRFLVRINQGPYWMR